MIERTGDIWLAKEEAILIPINLGVKADGKLIMGAGLAKQASDKYPGLALEWGKIQARDKDAESILHTKNFGKTLIGYPTKPWVHGPSQGVMRIVSGQLTDPKAYHQGWQCPYGPYTSWCKVGILRLILSNLESLAHLLRVLKIESVALPRLGCGLAGLDWERDVKPWLVDTLDDRFVVYHKA